MSKETKVANALSFRQTKSRWAYRMEKYTPAHLVPTPLFHYRDSSSLLPTTSFFHEIMLRARKYKNRYTITIEYSIFLCPMYIFYIESLTQNVIFHVKSYVTKHVFWELLIKKSQDPM